MGNKGKKNRVWVGFSQSEGFVSYSTKAGLARRIGVSVGKLERALEGSKVVILGGKEDWWTVWWVDGVEVVRQEARGVAKGRPVRSKIGRVTPAIGYDSVERLDSGKLVSVRRGETKTK